MELKTICIKAGFHAHNMLSNDIRSTNVLWAQPEPVPLPVKVVGAFAVINVGYDFGRTIAQWESLEREGKVSLVWE